MPDPFAMQRRYSLPFEAEIEGSARIDYGAELDRCAILAPSGNVRIGAASLTQCVIVEPCVIEDGVVAVAAILQGDIGRGCHIEAHADVRGTLQDDVTVRRGAMVQERALVGEGSEIGDGAVIGWEAEIGVDVRIGAQANIGHRAFVRDSARVPARAVVADDSYWNPADVRVQEGMPPDTIPVYLVDDEGEEDEDEEDDWDDESEDGERERWDDEGRWEKYGPDGGEGGGMVRGTPRLTLSDFQPGTARSWVLTKLARMAAFLSDDGRISKRLIRAERPDLIEHPVTLEVLRMQPSPTAEQLNEMAWSALSEPAYDVWTGIRFHSGAAPEWQMLGPRANHVFVLAVPERVWDEVTEEVDEQERRWLQSALFRTDQHWHPDRGIPRPVGWVRTTLYPHWALVVTEVQSDRPWMKFQWDPSGIAEDADELDPALIAEVATALRDRYLPTFAEDAINVVVEWAFTEHYREVWVLDYQSRKKLGGTPPRDFYDKFPKRYTVSAPQPLPDFVDVWDWARGVKARRIVPNGGACVD